MGHFHKTCSVFFSINDLIFHLLQNLFLVKSGKKFWPLIALITASAYISNLLGHAFDSRFFNRNGSEIYFDTKYRSRFMPSRYDSHGFLLCSTVLINRGKNTSNSVPRYSLTPLISFFFDSSVIFSSSSGSNTMFIPATVINFLSICSPFSIPSPFRFNYVY